MTPLEIARARVLKEYQDELQKLKIKKTLQDVKTIPVKKEKPKIKGSLRMYRLALANQIFGNVTWNN